MILREMVRSNKIAIIAMLGVWLSTMVACNSSGCLENRNSVPLAGFYGSDRKSITIDSVEISGLGMPEDEPLSAASERISSIYLPMRSTEPSTTWIFSYKKQALDYPELNDTLEFVYESTPYFASNECGVIFKYLITQMSYTTHLMDSVVLTDSLITNFDIEQIKIFFRTALPEEGGEE